MAVITAGYFAFERYTKNPEQIVPYPYQFESEASPVKLDAPILITGDSMGAYFGRFKDELAKSISVNLEKPIAIQSMAKEGFGIHRTLHDLKNLSPWPQIIIYHGGSEEFKEAKFHLPEIQKIQSNFKLYNDDRVETFLILYPWLSRFVYGPFERVRLAPEPKLQENISEAEYVKLLETELMLYEQHLNQLVALSKSRNSLMILVTTPINLDIRPKKVCEFSTNLEIEKEMLQIRELLKAGNPKSAYPRSSKLAKQHVGNAAIYYMHGQISRRVGQLDEARRYLLEASAYDCSPWRVTEIHNSIIRKIAKNQQVLLFDFARFVEKDFGISTTFFDELHPQNLYYEKGTETLGKVIKSILKL